MTDSITPEDFVAKNQLGNIGPLPLFSGTETNSTELIEAAGHNDYWLLSMRQIPIAKESPTAAQKYDFVPTLFRVTKTILGRAITIPDSEESKLYQVSNESALYFMPPMPWELVKKMDAFFRTVFKKLGTESVLVLYYDPDFWNSEDRSAGWYCIAPKQHNTAGACNYDPSDAVTKARKPSDIMMGTIHSHPNMSAFFSSTDHKDQADWDGVHITEAWRNDGPTEYHIAMILGGKEWTLSEDYVFGKPPIPPVNTDEIESWMVDVEKETITYGTSDFGYEGAVSRTFTAHSSVMPGTPKRVTVALPPDAPDPRTTVIVPRYHRDGNGQTCRLCNSILIHRSFEVRRCVACTSYVLYEGETIDDLVAARNAADCRYQLNIDPERAPDPIVIWDFDGTFSEDQRLNPKV